MNPELDALVSADEDARMRLMAAQTAARAQVASVRETIARERREEEAALAMALESELRAIEEASARRVEQRCVRREHYRAQRRGVVDSLLALATEEFVRVVRGDSEEPPR